MKVIFGMACDGRVYPDFPGEREAVLGDFVVGPLGLTEMLEIELGMAGPQASATGAGCRLCSQAQGGVDRETRNLL
ncbi:MAG: hypothetical protein IPO50_12830 [Sphingomonadales bacterium]|nr:hypothetical protein [Sphingomonadales bacterium]